MTAAERSVLGFAKQSAVGVPNTTDADFIYLLFNEGGMAPENIYLPLDQEVGGGAMLRNVVKTGVLGRGAMTFIPRPVSLGTMLLGVLGREGEATPAEANYEDVLAKTALTDATQELTTAITVPPTATNCFVRGFPAGGTLTGNVTITGTVGGTPGETDVIALNGATAVAGTKVFTAISKIDLPTRITAGDIVSVGYDLDADALEHKFTLPTDQFDAPYYTFRTSPGGIWGETFQDCRFSALALNWRAADFLRGQVGALGGLPTPNVSMTSWATPSYLDGSPQFLSVLTSVEVPDGTAMKVLSGSVAFGLAIPLDEQWITGSYSPDAFDINQRAGTINLVVKVPTNSTLYTQLMYDGTSGAATAWAAEVFREADIKIDFLSDQSPVSAQSHPYRLRIRANGQSGDNANMVWSAQPVPMRAGRQVLMSVTGTFLASPVSTLQPIRVSLVNAKATAY
jgi:hypothetical protein